MNKKIQPVILFLSILILGNTYAQKINLDSLENLLKVHQVDDTVKVNLLNTMANDLFTSDAKKMRSYATQALELSDKLFFKKGKTESLRLIGVSYTRSDQAKALTYFQNALKIAEEIDYKIEIIKCLNAIGDNYGSTGEDTKAIECSQKAFKIAEDMKNKLEMARCLSNTARYNGHLGHYEAAIEGYKKALEKALELNDKLLVANITHNLGVVFTNQGNYPLALEYFHNGFKIYEELKDKEGCFLGMYGIGNINFSHSDYSKALEYAQKSLIIAEELKDKIRISAALRLIGNIFQKTNNPQALEYFQKALIISEELNNIPATIITLISIGELYRRNGNFEKGMDCLQNALEKSKKIGGKNTLCKALYSIGTIHLQKKEYLSALDYSLRSLELAKELKLMGNQRDIHYQLSEIYASTNDYKKAYTNYKLFKTLNDSVFGKENVRKVAELEYTYKYEKEKQSIELEQQKKDAIHAVEKKQHKIIMFSLVVGFILMSFLAFYIYRSYLAKNKINTILTKQKQEIEAKNESLVQLNEEISAQSEEIVSQRDEIEAQRDMVVIQKDRIQAQKKEITDSIDYAKHIQQALLPSIKYTNSNLGDHFILFKPKDIVSGDFYWCSRVNEYLIVTVADCTGHGVPGAFMSMLGISFLNEIVGKKGITKASDILDHLRNSVIDALGQKWESGEQKDGMDLALVVINTNNDYLQFAGAQNPLYIVNGNKALNVLVPDNQTVAINIKMKPFTNHEVQLSKGDCIYLTSDGYHDQFGGPNNKKFKINQMKDLFVSISDKPMIEQGAILDKTFENWIGNHDQIDDVTIVGLKI